MTARANHFRPHERLGLSRQEACEYIGVSGSLFDMMVADGRMPRAKWINSRRVFDREEIEKAFRALPDCADGIAQGDNSSQIGENGDVWDDLVV